MEFKTDQFVVTVVGIMITLILVMTVMIPTFSGIERQMVGYENNYDAASYAKIYTPGHSGTIEIVIDNENDTATINGETVAIPIDNQNGIIAASDILQVVYTHTADYPSGSLWMCANLDAEDAAERRYVQYDSITISGGDAEHPTFNMMISLSRTVEGTEQEHSVYVNGGDLYYISNDGEYGLFAPTALKNAGVSYNDAGDLLGVIKLPRENNFDPITGIIGTFHVTQQGSLTDEEYYAVGSENQLGGYYQTEWYTGVTLDYTVTDHGAYNTLKITRATNTNTTWTTGFWVFAPIEYMSMEASAHAGIMMTILWLLPVLVVLGTMIVATRMMEWELPVIGRDRPKER